MKCQEPLKSHRFKHWTKMSIIQKINYKKNGKFIVIEFAFHAIKSQCSEYYESNIHSFI